MYIVHIASELAPIAKVGGLADMVYGLTKATIKAGHFVEILLPKYNVLRPEGLKNLKIKEKNFLVTENEKTIENTIWSARYEDLHILLIEAHHPNIYFNRGKIYGEIDDNDRFIYFCKAAIELLYKRKKLPDVLHLHDWLASASAILCREKKIQAPKIVLSIHNLKDQGRCDPHNFESIGLDAQKYLAQEELGDPSHPESLNLLKGAIKYSDAITTVSPTFTQEIQTPEGGFGLDVDLSQSKNKLTGILNRIDTDYWNPQTDPFLVKRYTLQEASSGKLENKRYIQSHFMLEQNDKPLVIAITRLTAQKGPDLIYYGIERAAELGGQFVLLGSAQDPTIQAHFEKLKITHGNDPDIAICLDYDEPLAHLLYAAADMLLMPSIFEPCGLAQMIALRYGTIPLVRRVGGLKDTVFDPNRSEHPNGLTFDIPDNREISLILERAFKLFRDNPKTWQQLIQNAMTADLSWSSSVGKYLEIYEST